MVGAGVHSIFFTENALLSLPNTELTWISSDPDVRCLSSIITRTEFSSNRKLQSSIAVKKLTLDENGFMEEVDFETEQTDLIICVNMIHISPWEATLGLMKEASKRLKSNKGYLYCYGPYLEKGNGAMSNL